MTWNILLTCEDYLPHVGGAEVCVHNLKKQFEHLGHTVTLYTNTTERCDLEEPGVVRVPWKFSCGGLLRNIQELWRLIGVHTIVHCQYSFRLACLCGLIARLRRKPMILTQQGKGIVPEENPRFLQSLFTKLCQVVSMRCAHHLTATSDEILELAAAFVPRGKIKLISNGYDAERFHPDTSLPVPEEFALLPPGTCRLFSVRRLVPKNGIHIMVQALALVRNQDPHFHYCVIGEGRARGFIEELIATLDLGRHVTLLGKRSNDELPAYYQHCDLIVIPSSAEARSIACIEAMGMGKPVIASCVGGLIDLIGRDNTYGTLVPIYDSEACTYDPPDTLPQGRLQVLADVVLHFLRDPLPFHVRARAAMEEVKTHYSWAAIAAQYLSLYQRLLH